MAKAAAGSVGRPSPTPDDLDMGDVDGLDELDPAPDSADKKDPEAWNKGLGRVSRRVLFISTAGLSVARGMQTRSTSSPGTT
ncbi:hypothetical protein ABZ468_00005 [Streptomyces sp. NPDC005708]|uniref:hypothetical protein n=1 Tax=Streptomyces sp. NPDC005708 TaxID=3154564 RepID=UPI0033DB76BC